MAGVARRQNKFWRSLADWANEATMGLIRTQRPLLTEPLFLLPVPPDPHARPLREVARVPSRYEPEPEFDPYA